MERMHRGRLSFCQAVDKPVTYYCITRISVLVLFFQESTASRRNALCSGLLLFVQSTGRDSPQEGKPGGNCQQ